MLRNSEWDRNGVVAGILKDVALPKMALVEQSFDSKRIDDIPAVIRRELGKTEIASTLHGDMRVAITAGSRGIKNIVLILREIVSVLKNYGVTPFIIPAMGSHGGATAKGQVEVLNALGITEESVGAPIESTMETVHLGFTDDGKEVRIDKNAYNADGIVVVNRIKVHTAFHGRYESGLYKMMTIGLGKQEGAEICHSEGFGKMAHNIQYFGDVHVENRKILFGVGIVENAFDETSIIEAIPRERIKDREPELLDLARKMMPKLFFDDIDVMIVDQIGKNYSGSGQDPNITGAYGTPYVSGKPEVQRYVILDLSDETHGNGIGAGRAEFATKRLFDKLDFDSFYPNALTCTVITGAKVPMILNNDKLAIQAAVFTCVGIDKKNPRIVRISNTSNVRRIMVSEALAKEIEKSKNMRFLTNFKPFAFDGNGNLRIGECTM